MLTALMQGPADSSSVAANLAAIETAAAAAAHRGARILVCPEMSATGYNIGAALAERAEPPDGPIARAIARIARERRIAVVYGYPERDGGLLYNATAAVDRDGAVLARYRKTHLFGELDRGHFAPGAELVAQFELDGLRCGLLTCYDVEFPEAARAHALAGADWLIVPTGLMHPFAPVAEILVPARALENQVFVTYANRVGHEGDIEYCGRSVVVAPDGAVLARAGQHEALLFAELDPARAAASRALYTYLADRRTDLYPPRDAHLGAPVTTPVGPGSGRRTLSMIGPDFPFPYDDHRSHPAGLGAVPAAALGAEVAVVGGGLAGVITAYELMRIGLRPVVYEAEQLGGRMRSAQFDGFPGTVAELGAMRFPLSSTTLHGYIAAMGLRTRPFANPLAPDTPSTVVDLKGEALYARGLEDLPPRFRRVALAWGRALEDGASLGPLKEALRSRDPVRIKAIWNDVVRRLDDHTFYRFLADSPHFRSFRDRELFGQVGFGTGGWDTDFPNSILEVLRIVATGADEHQHLVVGGCQQLPLRLWAHRPAGMTGWPAGTSLESLHSGAPLPAVTRLRRSPDGIAVTDAAGLVRAYPAVVYSAPIWLLLNNIDCDESLFSSALWTAVERTHYMGSSKVFVLVDRPFWRDVDPETGREAMSMTLTDRMSRGTYLFDDGPGRPAAICLSYTWADDSLRLLPLSAEERMDLMLHSLGEIYPGLDIRRHIIAPPITISWEMERNFMGAFKANLPGHYRYQERLFGHFMQDAMPDAQRGIFLAGDDISWTAAWAEGAVQSALNAVWGVVHHLGGACAPENPGPGDRFAELAPLRLPDVL